MEQITDREIGGILLINKPEGCTSHDVVNRVRKLFATKKVGHTGTLDPMATGVLAVLVGKAVKASEYLLSGEKSYVAGLKFGIATDTQDTTGNIVCSSSLRPTQEELLDVIGEFVGDIMQKPPMYSALKVGGKKLCDLAREGKSVDVPARPIRINGIKLLDFDQNEVRISVDCSHGTYIRTLCHDIGEKLGCFGAMSALQRTRVDRFDLAKCHTLDELEEMDVSERYLCLIPVETAFEELPKVSLPEFYARLFENGNEIYQKKIGASFEIGERLRVYTHGKFTALAEIREFEEGTAIFGIKRF